MKAKTSFVCSQCGYESPKWLGRCSQCGEWDTMVEKTTAAPVKAAAVHQRRRPPLALEQDRPQPVQEIDSHLIQRLDLGFGELNRVLGGGLVPGTLVLLAGDPGIGKSPYCFRLRQSFGEAGKVWYITGEESVQQVKLRAGRMGTETRELWLWAQTDMEKIMNQIQAEQPSLIVIDSIQTMFLPELESSPGSLVQIRECTAGWGFGESHAYSGLFGRTCNQGGGHCRAAGFGTYGGHGFTV